eukprot:2015253-Prymnesium_polylepis.1
MAPTAAVAATASRPTVAVAATASRPTAPTAPTVPIAVMVHYPRPLQTVLTVRVHQPSGRDPLTRARCVN